MVSTLVNQIIIMFLLAGIGFFLFRSGKITEEGSKSIGNILIYFVLPAVIVKGFIIERTMDKMIALGISTVIGLVVLGISIAISYFFFSKNAIASFASAFSNPGFFGVPLIIASISSDAVFYIASFIGFLNLLQWTYGVSIMTGKAGKVTLKKLCAASFMIAIVIGLILFLSQIELPMIVESMLVSVTNLNTPLAMFTVGIYLAQTDIKKMFLNKQTYAICFTRLLLIPMISIVILGFIPSQFHDMKLALLIAIACPVGSNVAVYAQLHHKNYTYAVETVVMSTLFSILTIPVIQFCGNYFLK